MRALVTGSAGFIGRHMVSELSRRGWTVYGVDLESHIFFEPYVYTEQGNALLAFEEYTDNGFFDLVVHCAYHVGGRAAIDGVNTNFAKNLQLDAAMFEWAVRTKQKRVLYFSSSAAYPVWRQEKCPVGCSPSDNMCQDGPTKLAEWMMYEAAPTAADANYGFAKCVGERLAEDARKNGLAVSVVRPFSGYAEDQSLDYPFPSIVARASSGDLSVWGPPGQTRDWIHVSDVVAGALAVVESETTDPVNLCTGRGVEMGELALMIYKQHYNCDHEPYPECDHKITYDESKPTGVFYRVGDPTRMLQYYRPMVDLEEGIQRALKVLK